MSNPTNTYYFIGNSAEITSVFVTGFHGAQYGGKTSGVYLADSPGEPDPDYLDDQLLEITLPPAIDISRYKAPKKAFKEGTQCRWREWFVPAGGIGRLPMVSITGSSQ